MGTALYAKVTNSAMTSQQFQGTTDLLFLDEPSPHVMERRKRICSVPRFETGCGTCTQGLCEFVHWLIGGRHFGWREDSGRGGVWSPDKACNEGARLPAMLLRLDGQWSGSPCQPVGLTPCHSPASIEGQLSAADLAQGHLLSNTPQQ